MDYPANQNDYLVQILYAYTDLYQKMWQCFNHFQSKVVGHGG